MRPIKHVATLVALSAASLTLTACPKDKAEPLTLADARDAAEESNISSQASALTSNTVEITTNFTIGGAVQNAAAEVRTFVQSQLPCAEIALADATLTITYGAKPGNCTYRGNTYSGEHSVKVSRNEEKEVVVEHTWTDLSNGKVKVSGTATATWSLANKSRRVQHDMQWTRISDGRTGRGTGDRTQTALNGNIAEGISVNGSRTWEGKSGKWELAIEGVEARWVDPIPQAGRYRLASPKNQSIELTFSRVDADTIKATVKSGDKTFSFNVTSAGGVKDDA
ncbi:MAG: hypothetical protein KC657_38415 [Myxococcales bacterium]|nr:hypothetical protein [Myxococcales bacterium]